MLISVIIVVLMANVLGKQWTPLVLTVFVVGGIALLLLGQRWVAIYQSKKINDILMEECDPDGFVQVNDYLIKQLTESKAPPALWLNLGTGLDAMGNHEEALKVLQDNDWIRHSGSKHVRLTYYHNLVWECIKHQDFNQADKLLTLVEHMMPKLNLRKSLLQRFQRSFLQDRITIQMEKGDYTDAEAVFLKMHEHAVNRYERINAKMTLGDIYTHLGDIDKAKDAYMYVVTLGNKLHVVMVAKAYLNK